MWVLLMTEMIVKPGSRIEAMMGVPVALEKNLGARLVLRSGWKVQDAGMND
jgi:hypothetical protein